MYEQITPTPQVISKNQERLFFVLGLNPLTIAKTNGRTIIQNSTAYPFRLPESSIMCIFCSECFPEAALFRQHMIEEHENFDIKLAFAHINCGLLKVDITELSCRICSTPFDNLDDIADHLITVHSKNIYLDYGLGLQPYYFENEHFICAICKKKTPSLVALSRHTAIHFKSCICEQCGKAFASSGSLRCHVRNACSKDGQARCRKCRKAIRSMKEHLKESLLCRPYICGVCGDRFATTTYKRKHMESAHSLPAKTFPCPECNVVFKTCQILRKHFGIHHTENYLECFCGLKYISQSKFDRHMTIHTGEKLFVCDVCDLSYNRKSNLTQHMWVHSKIKRFTCFVCDKPFNQKSCLKTHMKSQHPDIDDFNEFDV